MTEIEKMKLFFKIKGIWCILSTQQTISTLKWSNICSALNKNKWISAVKYKEAGNKNRSSYWEAVEEILHLN